MTRSKQQRALPLSDERAAKLKLAEIEAHREQTHNVVHRAIDAKYNLLRVSQRRWAVVCVSSTVTVLLDMRDVVIFERITKPLPLGAAVIELERRRSK